jgi:hypothetical protein
MPFPRDLDALKAAGYVFQNHAVCRGCGQDVEWYLTPRGSKIPMDPMNRGTSPAISHFSTCPDSDSFRKER